MPVTVRIPAQLRSLTQGLDEVQAEGQTVAEVIDALDQAYPGLRDRLRDDKGVLRHVNIYRNDEDIRFEDSLETRLAAGDALEIVPAIAGGAP
jgi:molybdopterin synthase sulfur carrier subunit